VVRADGALQQSATRKSRLNVLDFIVVNILLKIGTPVLVLVLSLSYFGVVDVSFLACIRAMVLRAIMGVRETTLPSFSEALFHDTLKYFHFASNFFYLSPK